jgi:hypothetical protein
MKKGRKRGKAMDFQMLIPKWQSKDTAIFFSSKNIK